MYKVMKSFICRACVNPVTGTRRTSVDIGGDANLELVDKFCYLGDMLSVEGDANAAVEIRVRSGWNKFRQLIILQLCAKYMLHGSQTWPVRKENEVTLQQAQMRMVRWMCGMKLQYRLPSKELRERLGLDVIISVLQQNRL